MRTQLIILNTRDVKKVLTKIKDQFNIKELKLDYTFLRNNKGRIFITNRNLAKIDTYKLQINSIGLYFANDYNEIRLTIEATQLIGKLAKKNILNISDSELITWFSGQSITTTKKFSGFVIIKHNEDFLGSGKYLDGKILNYVNKERWIRFI